MPRLIAPENIQRATPTPQRGVVGFDGTAEARAMGNLGQTVERIGDNMHRANAEEARAQEAARNAADHAASVAKINATRDQLSDLYDQFEQGVSSGQIDKTKAGAEWESKALDLVSKSVEGIPEKYKAQGLNDLSAMRDRLGNRVGRAVAKRDMADTLSGVNQTLEYAQRLHATNPTIAQKLADDTLEQLGPFAGMSPDQVSKARQTWRENAQFTRGYEAISAGRTDPKALAAAEKLVGELPDLDPQRRATLLDRAQGYRLAQEQRAEMAAARRQREADAHLKRAEAAYSTFQSLADKGTTLDPTYVDQALAMTQGTPYQGGIVALARQAKETGGFAAQPIAIQRATLQAVDAEIATKGRSPELDKRREQLQRVLSGSERDLDQDGLQAGLERGVIARIEPLNVTGGIAGLVSQMGNRSVQAEMVQSWAGRPVSPLTRQEADSVSGLLSAMPVQQRASALRDIAQTMSPAQAQALAIQMNKSDRGLALALAYGASSTTWDRPTSELILRGQEALKAKTVKLEDAAETGMTASFEKALGGALPNPTQAAQVREAAKLIWAGKKAEGDSIDAGRALRLALGGHVVEHNGSNVVASLNIGPGELSQRLGAYPKAALSAQLPDGKVYVRGQAVDAEQFLRSLPAAKLRTLARDRFAVVSGDAVVTNSQAVPVVVDLSNAR